MPDLITTVCRWLRHLTPPAAALTLLAIVSPSCSAPGSGSDNGYLTILSTLDLPRTTAGRLSIVRKPGCGPASATKLPCPPIGADVQRRAADVGARASADLRASASPDAMRAVALLDLTWSDPEGKSIGRSISYLQAAARVIDRPSATLSDLAAAFIERATRAGSPRDLIEAIEAASTALEADSTNNDARFNLALAMQRLGLVDQAKETWGECAKHEPDRDRVAEIDAQLRALQPPASPTLSERASAQDIASFVAADPLRARMLGWIGALGSWGTHTVGGDTAAARVSLNFARGLGDELARRGKDQTLRDAVTAVDASTSADRARLAQAHASYARGYTQYDSSVDYAAARESFANAIQLGARSQTLVSWATAFHGAASAYLLDLVLGESELRRVASTTDTLRHPALAGRVRWMLGTTLLRTLRSDSAIHEAETASRLFTRAGENEFVGAAKSLETQARYVLGGGPDMYAAMGLALELLSPHRESAWLYTLLATGALAAERDGLRRAAARFQDEAVAVSTRAGRAINIVEAHITRARIALALNDAQRAGSELTRSQALFSAVPPGPIRTQLEAYARLTSAMESMHRAPRNALEVLDPAVAYFRTPVSAAWLIPALTARAEVQLSLGDTVAGLADLRSAIGVLGAERDRTFSLPLRASLIDAARQVFDRVIMLEIGAGHNDAALARLEEARALATVGSRIGSATRQSAEPDSGVTIVDYALIGDTLLTWTLRGRDLQLVRASLDRSRLARVTAQTVAALEVGADADASRADLQQLFEWLMRPIVSRIGAAGSRVVIIADGEVNAVPFPALIDSRSGHYLIQDYTLLSAGSLRSTPRAGSSNVRQPNRTPSLLAVNPSFDPRRHPELPPLAGAAAEVDSLAALYAGSSKLDGDNASRGAVLAAFGRTAVVHYAGHAILDDERPERSSLVLAASPPEADVLRADELAALDLSAVKLVVLSACQTLGSRAGHTRGLAGLADAFVTAGAGGVVASQWRIDDRLTLDLMMRFHRAYRDSSDPAAALRRAQLEMIADSSATLSAPSAWAGFRYVGR